MEGQSRETAQVALELWPGGDRLFQYGDHFEINNEPELWRLDLHAIKDNPL